MQKDDSTNIINPEVRPAKMEATRLEGHDGGGLVCESGSPQRDGSTQPFSGVTICFAGIHPYYKEALCTKAHDLGARHTSYFTESTTHLVTDAPGSVKNKCASAIDFGIPICTSNWIIESHERWLAGDEVDLEKSMNNHLLLHSDEISEAKPLPTKRKATQTDDHDGNSWHKLPRTSTRSDVGSEPFAKLVICFSNTRRRRAFHAMVVDLGATCSHHLTDLTTHLVTDVPTGAKYECAVDFELPVCTSDWIVENYKQWLHGHTVDLEKSASKYLLPPLKGLVVCVTQLSDHDSRERLSQCAKQLGALYSTDTSKDVTHLLIGPDPGDSISDEKLEWVERINAQRRDGQDEKPQIAVVWDVWLLMCVASNTRITETEYAYSKTEKRPQPLRVILNSERKQILPNNTPQSDNEPPCYKVRFQTPSRRASYP